MLYFIAFYQFYENAYNFAYSICEISDNVDKMSQSLYLFVKNRNLVDLHPIQLWHFDGVATLWRLLLCETKSNTSYIIFILWRNTLLFLF